MISFVRLAMEVAVRNGHSCIEPVDTRSAEEENYSFSKHKYLIIKNQKQYPYAKNLLDYMAGWLHKQSRDELLSKMGKFVSMYDISEKQPNQILRQLFNWGVIGVELKGGSGVKRKGGTHFVYYYENPSINPLNLRVYCVHPSLRHHLSISEKRERSFIPTV